MDTYTAKPHTVRAGRYGERRWNVEVAPGEHVILTDGDFHARYAPVPPAGTREDAADDEWCVMHDRFPDEPHRGPMSEQDARRWIEEWQEMDDNADAREGMFYLARRPVGRWERA